MITLLLSGLRVLSRSSILPYVYVGEKLDTFAGLGNSVGGYDV
jgi:hypothetical protein